MKMANRRADSPNWLLALSLYATAIFLNHVTSQAWAGRVVTSNSILPQYNGPQDILQRRLLNGREVIPPMSPNAIPGEPSCEELRAMWRYYKRQSRAEFTNEIPRFGSNMFWDILPAQQQQPQISSFAPVKGRSRARLKLKNPKTPVYGRMMHKQERDRQRNKQISPRPMEKVAQMMGKGTEGKERGPAPEAVIHFSPPPTLASTTPSSLQQIKEVFREERMRDKTPENSHTNTDGKTFGRIILGPPRGMDGRVANKPRELMTPFEKIRFGHADDLLEEGSKPNMNLMAKRRSLPLHKFQSRQTRVGPVEGADDTVWMDDGLELGESVIDADFGGMGGSWGSLPLSYGGLMDEEISPQEKFGLVMMQQPQQPFQNLKTVSHLHVPELPPLMDSPTCPEIDGQSCQSNSDCSCVGFGLYRCYINQCQTLTFSPPAAGSPMEDNEDASSLWHTGPLHSSKLGLWENTPAEDITVIGNTDMNSRNGYPSKMASNNVNTGIVQFPSATLDEKNMV